MCAAVIHDTVLYVLTFTYSYIIVTHFDTPICTHPPVMKGTLTEPLIVPPSPEPSEEAAQTKADGAHHRSSAHGHQNLPSKDYEVSPMVAMPLWQS